MCTGAEYMAVAAALSTAGTAASYMSAEEKAAAQKRAIQQGIEDEAAIQSKANDRTQDYVKETFDPTKRAQNYENEAAKTERSFADLLASQSAQGDGGISDATTGAVSSEYLRSKAEATARASDRAQRLSRLLARGGAMGGLMGSEAITGADYASDMLGYGVQSNMARNRANVRAGAAGNAGNGLALLGGLLSGGAGAAGQYGVYYQRPRQ